MIQSAHIPHNDVLKWHSCEHAVLGTYSTGTISFLFQQTHIPLLLYHLLFIFLKQANEWQTNSVTGIQETICH